MEKEEMLEQTNETENTGTDTAEKFEEQGNTTPAEGKEPKGNEEKFTQEDVDKIVKERVYRTERKVRDEYEQKYGHLEDVLKAGLGTNDLDETTKKLTDFYKGQGVKIPETRLTRRQEEILANAEADDIINNGYDDIVSSVSRLANKGADKMTEKEKLMFTRLANEKTRQEGIKELAKIGVSEDVLNEKEFKDFSENLNPKLSVKEKYELYQKFKPRKEIETMGSMQGNTSKDDGVKEFYSREEAKKFSRADLDKNPKLMEAIENSMAKWK